MGSCHYISDIPHIPRLVIFLVLFIHHTEKAYCETEITGHDLTLSCSLSSSSESVKWTHGADETSMTLSLCDENRCFDNTRYVETSGLHVSALRNVTFSWMNLSSDTQGDFVIACKVDDTVIRSFNVTFIDANMIPDPQCDVFPYEKDTSKVKFKCEVDSTQGVQAKLEITGAGENMQESPNLVYSIVDYILFINDSDVNCKVDIKGITKSCVFPRGIRINNITDGDDVIFEIEANFEIDDLMIDWQFVKIDNTVLDTTKYSLFFRDKKKYMLFRNTSSRADTEGIIVKCQITRSENNQNKSDLLGVGFISLDSYKIQHSENTPNESESSTANNKNSHENQECPLYVLLAIVFLGVLLINACIAVILCMRKSRKKHPSTGVLSVNQGPEASESLSRGDRVMAAEERPQGVQPVDSTQSDKYNESNNQSDMPLDVYAISPSITDTCNPQDGDHGFENVIYYVVDRFTPPPDMHEQSAAVACNEANCDDVVPGAV